MFKNCLTRVHSHTRTNPNALWLCILATISSTLLNTPAFGGEADIVKVEATKSSGNWRFDVTVRHDDTGWDHYADKWDVVGPDGTVYGTRVLAHPHENEQPFTRSLSGVEIPEQVTEVEIRAHDSVHEYGGKMMKVTLER
jgi:hypothetical protein